MAKTRISGARIAGIATCVPQQRLNNSELTDLYTENELRKVIGMVGIQYRHVSDGSLCSTDLCLAAARNLLQQLDWDPGSVDGLIMVTQTPDYLLPSSSCLLHRDLALSEDCATFDVGLGCSGYPYGLWLAHMMIASGQCRRVILAHGETPSLFTNPKDRSTALLFGDAGSATAIEADPEGQSWAYNLKTDGGGYNALIIPAGGFRERHTDDAERCFVHMNGPQLFTFTTQKVPALIEESLDFAQISSDGVNYFVFHQANRFITRHIAKKIQVSEDRIPSTIENFGNTGGVSVPLTITQGLKRINEASVKVMVLGYGVGLSWGSALIDLQSNTLLTHTELDHAELSTRV